MQKMGCPDEVIDKLALMREYLGELDACVQVDADDYRDDCVTRRAVERLCQLVVECASDICVVLLEDKGVPAPRSAREAYSEAYKLGLIDKRSRDRFVSSYVGLRNRIVHDYEKLDDVIILNSARRLVDDGRRFVGVIADLCG